MKVDPLKLAVERIVKPIRVYESLKDTYRKELWAHLSDLYEVELASDGDSDRALEDALSKLGKPDELRTQYLKSLGLHYRCAAVLFSAMQPKEGETLFRYLVRSAFLSWPFIFVPTIWAAATIALRDSANVRSIAPALVGLNLGFLLCVFVSAICLMVHRSRDKSPRELKVRLWYRHFGFLPSIAIATVALASFVPLALEYLILTFMHVDTARLTEMTLFLSGGYVGLFILVALFAPVTFMRHAGRTRKISDWPYSEV